jgi:hypothetical protein
MNLSPRTRPAARLLAVTAALAASAAAHATITVYTSAPSFLAAVSAAGTDTFDALPLGALAAPLSGGAGSHPYTATDSVDPSFYDAGSPIPAGSFYVTGIGADHWLSSNAAGDTITFQGLGGVHAIGGLFFGTDIDGALQAGATLRLVATDSGGSVSQILLDPGSSIFRGFVSDGALVSLAVSSLPGGFASTAFPTVNDLILAAPVPEPQAAVLLLAGLGLLLARRRAA